MFLVVGLMNVCSKGGRVRRHIERFLCDTRDRGWHIGGFGRSVGWFAMSLSMICGSL